MKQENIVLGNYGEVRQRRMLDWGLAKQIVSADEETAPVVFTESPTHRVNPTSPASGIASEAE